MVSQVTFQYVLLICSGTSHLFTLKLWEFKGHINHSESFRKREISVTWYNHHKTRASKSQIHSRVCSTGLLCSFLAKQQWSKAQKLLNHHQVTIIISRVTEVQGRNLLVTARKSTSHDNETILLGDHHKCPPTHFWVRHSKSGKVSAPFISYKSKRWFQMSIRWYSMYSHLLLGSGPIL